MNIALIVLLAVIILLLIILVRKIDILDKKAVKYIRVFRSRRDFDATKTRFKELGYEISNVHELSFDWLEIIFVRVK